jgi:uncharacterized protein
MTVVVDAGPLLAQADADEPRHALVRAFLASASEPMITTELVAAEADYLMLDRLGVAVELAFIDDLVAGTFVVECLDRTELEKARSVVAQYRDLRVGLADASLIVLAERYSTRRVLTFDERAFRAIAPLQGGSFVILPADENIGP